MKEYYLTKEKIDAFASMLYQAEKSKATIEKYLRSIRMFSQYLAGNPVNKSAAITWKEQLQQQNGLDDRIIYYLLGPRRKNTQTHRLLELLQDRLEELEGVTSLL